MGQQLGLPAARATTQEVLGPGSVETFTLAAAADWRLGGPLRMPSCHLASHAATALAPKLVRQPHDATPCRP